MDKSNTTIDLDYWQSLSDSELEAALKRRPREEQISIVRQLMQSKSSESVSPKKVLRTRAEVARHFGVGPQTITDWLARPDFPGRVGQRFTGDGGYFPIDEIEAWRNEQLKKAGRLPPDNEGDEDSCAEAIQQERLRKLKLENDELAGLYIDLEITKRAVVQITEIAKQRLYQLVESIPGLLPRQLPKATKNEVRNEIKAAIDCVTNEISIDIHKLKDGIADGATGDPA